MNSKIKSVWSNLEARFACYLVAIVMYLGVLCYVVTHHKNFTTSIWTRIPWVTETIDNRPEFNPLVGMLVFIVLPALPILATFASMEILTRRRLRKTIMRTVSVFMVIFFATWTPYSSLASMRLPKMPPAEEVITPADGKTYELLSLVNTDIEQSDQILLEKVDDPTITITIARQGLSAYRGVAGEIYIVTSTGQGFRVDNPYGELTLVSNNGKGNTYRPNNAVVARWVIRGIIIGACALIVYGGCKLYEAGMNQITNYMRKIDDASYVPKPPPWPPGDYNDNFPLLAMPSGNDMHLSVSPAHSSCTPVTSNVGTDTNGNAYAYELWFGLYPGDFVATNSSGTNFSPLVWSTNLSQGFMPPDPNEETVIIHGWMATNSAGEPASLVTVHYANVNQVFRPYHTNWQTLAVVARDTNVSPTMLDVTNTSIRSQGGVPRFPGIPQLFWRNGLTNP